MRAVATASRRRSGTASPSAGASIAAVATATAVGAVTVPGASSATASLAAVVSTNAAGLVGRSAGATLTATVTSSVAGSARKTAGAALAATATIAATGTAQAPLGTLTARVNGPSRIRVQTGSTTSVRLKIGTDTAVTAGLVYTSAVTPDADGWAEIPHPTGLTAGGWYYYRVGMTDANGTEAFDTGTVAKFRVAPVGQTSFNFTSSACCDATDSAAMTAIANRNDDLYIHTGDLWYADGTVQTASNYKTQMGNKLRVANHAAVFRSTSSVFTPSDHDFGMNNNIVGSNAPNAVLYYNQTYRQMIPAAPVPTTTGIYHTFTWGRVRFIVLDCRTFKSLGSATDDATKTQLGATQKQWLKDTITASTSALNIIVGDVPWTGPTVTNDDHWAAYNTERQELAAYMTTSGKNFAYIAGDMHALAAETLSTRTYCDNLAVFMSAALNNSASIKGDPYTYGPYPASGTATVQQYGRFQVTDNGDTLDLTWTGYDSANTVRVGPVTKTYNVSTTPAMPVGDLPADAVAPSGWKQVLAEPFTTDVALGSFLSSTYATNGWTVYGKGVPRTDTTGPVWANNHTSFYDNGDGIKVTGGVLSVRCHTDANGIVRTDTLRPPDGKGRQQLYGVYEIAYRLPAPLPGYKQAWLLWPADGIGSHGEIDFPESDFDDGSVIKGFVHRADGVVGNAASYTSTTDVTDGKWHVTRIVWSPGRVQFYLDGTLVKDYTSSTLVLSQEGTWRIQTEGNLSGTTPLITAGAADNTGIDPATDGYVEIAYAAAWTRNAPGAGASVAATASITAAGSVGGLVTKGAALAATATTTAAGTVTGAGATFVKVVGTNALTTAATSISVTVPAGGVAAGNTLFLIPNGNGVGSAAATPATDSRGNTYVSDRASTSSTGGQFVSGYIATALQAGDVITFTGTASISSRLLTVLEFSGVSGADTGVNISASATAGTTVSSGASPTTTQANEVLIGLFGTSGSTNNYSTITAGWTEASRLIGSARTSLVAYRIVNATGSFSFGGTTSTAVDLRAALQAYKAT